MSWSSPKVMPFLLMLHFKICRCFPWLPLPGRGSSCSKGLATPFQEFPEAPREWDCLELESMPLLCPEEGPCPTWTLPSRANPWGAKATQTGKETSPGLGNPSPAKASWRAWLPPALSRLSPAFGDVAPEKGSPALLLCQHK